MKVLLTGSFGNVGESTLEVLVNRNHEVTCFDKRTVENMRVARRFKNKVKKIIWGDIRNYNKVEKAVKGQDIVLHVAAVIPPKANRNEKRTAQINFGGTRNVVDAILAQEKQPKLIYTSSVAIYGDIRHLDNHTLSENSPPNPSPGDHYAVTKINAEKYIKESGIENLIFRLSYIPNSRKMNLTPLMFKMPLDTPIEMTHTKDCGLALANAIDKEGLFGKVFNLGGGKSCQCYYRDYLNQMLPMMGIEMLPDEAFSSDPFHCCFYDTKELNQLLNFQNFGIDDLLQEMVDSAKSKRQLAKIFKPVIKPFLLSLSPYYKENKRKKKNKRTSQE